MTTHTFSPTRFYNSIGSHEPVLKVGDGDTVVTETLDAHGFDRHGEKRADGPNPMTGPFYVSGAEPGDALLIRIDRITMIRSTGWTFQVLSPNVVNPGAVARFPERVVTDWIIDIATGRARLTKPPAALRDWSVAVKPMIGCFGVAPAMGQSISTATSGPYGGNMDYRGFGAGVEVMFPVSAPGGLFFLGDVHAAQGDGEIVGTGIETAAEVQFTVAGREKETDRLATWLKHQAKSSPSAMRGPLTKPCSTRPRKCWIGLFRIMASMKWRQAT